MDEPFYTQGEITSTQAMKELSRETGFKNNPKWLLTFISECINEEYNKYGGLGSLRGWVSGTKPQILEKIKNKIEFHEKALKLLRQIRFNFKIYLIFLKMYKDSYYKPGGTYMKSIESNYSHLFENTHLKPNIEPKPNYKKLIENTINKI